MTMVSFEEALRTVRGRARAAPAQRGVPSLTHTPISVLTRTGSRSTLRRLIGMLDQVGTGELGRACSRCTIPIVSRGTGGRIIGCSRGRARAAVAWCPYCRLDPADDPVGEAERCVAAGARGIKLHPRAQAFGFGDPAAEAIFVVAREARIPILIHAGRGMPTMAPLADLALRHPEVGPRARPRRNRRSGHLRHLGWLIIPRVVYDTSCFSPVDVVELFARIPGERIVFASDAPYGRPVGGLFLALRAAARAGLDADDRALVAAARWRPARGRGLARAAPAPAAQTSVQRAIASGQPVSADGLRGRGQRSGGRSLASLPWVELARAARRDPEPRQRRSRRSIHRRALAGAEAVVAAGGPQAFSAVGC